MYHYIEKVYSTGTKVFNRLSQTIKNLSDNPK
jgi:hypothetical protein